ncbi:hypothetical protein DIPPA_29273 [Diplonema papillatum]|nr:hypothetical protein DIPPA_29273 [Diplonema papillatum]
MTVCALVGAVAALGYSEWVKAGVDDVVFPMERFTRGDGLEYVGTNTVDCSVKDPSGNKVNVPAPVGYMEFGFTVPEDALYTVKVNLLATDSLADSFWGQLDGGAKMKWFAARGNDFFMVTSLLVYIKKCRMAACGVKSPKTGFTHVHTSKR